MDSIARTQDEIVARIEELRPNDIFGFDTIDLIGALDFEHAKPYLKPECTAESWEPVAIDRESVLARMLDYMPFAWGKANDCRGISANRSVSRFMAWIWLIGDDLGDLMDGYAYYGKEALTKVCNHYGWDASQWDDGVRTNG